MGVRTLRRRSLVRLARVQSRPVHDRVLIVAVAAVAYGVVASVAFTPLNPASVVLAGLPVVLAGWLLGTRWGLLSGLCVFPLSGLLFAAEDVPVANYILDGIPATLGFGVIGLTVGALRDLSQKLRASREQLRTIIANAPMVIFAVDADGTVTLEEGKALSRIGFRHGSSLGRNFFTLYEGTQPEAAALVRRALAGEETSRLFSGGDLAFEVHFSPVREGERVVGAIGVAFDVSARVAAEGRFRKFFELTPLASSITRLSDGRVVDVNQNFLDTFKFSRDAVLGKTTVELGLWDHQAERELLARTIEREGAVQNLQFEARTSQGELRTFLGSWALVELDGVRHMVGSRLDVTDRLRAEERLRQSEERFQRMFRRNPTGLLVSRVSDAVIIDVNETWLAATGFARADIIGKTVFDLGLWVEPSARRMLTERLKREGSVRDYEFKRRVRSGEIREALGSFELIDFGGERCVLTCAIDITDRKRAEQALEHRALHDDLTGLPNRVLLYDRLEQAIRTARRDGGSVALVVMDLDHFKEVNDTFGHHAGDELLRQVGPRLAGLVRERDTVARLGGDEFALILPGARAAAAKRVARAVLEALAEPFVVEGGQLHVEASLGVAGYPEHGEDGTTLMRRADIAMYVAKRTGGTAVEYSSDDDGHTPERLALLGELGKAIENDELVLHFHPEVSLRTGRIIGMEALVRWQHPVRGLLPPDSFIPLAERTGLMRPLTLWVLRHAIERCRAWRDEGLGLRVAVNLSARSLDPELPEQVGKLLDEAHLPPALLALEITESVILTERALETLARLRRIGIRLAIDDFGTGYSSLGYLQELAVHQVKIDKSFVIGMRVDRGSAAIVRATVELAHNLGFEVVAEGIEDGTTCDLLAKMECDLAQGFHVARPMPADEISAWLSAYDRAPLVANRVPA